MNFDVEDILNARTSLRKRALAARQVAADEAAHQQHVQDRQLVDDASGWLREICCATDAEMADVVFEIVPYTDSTRAVRWTLDAVRFQARYERKRVMVKSSPQFDDEVIFDDTLLVEVNVLGQNGPWKRVKTLSDLGGWLA